MKRIVFTDLDGTVLDRLTYSYEKSLSAITLLKAKAIPIVFCSAKTRPEQEEYRRELGIDDPFIVENGGAVFIPHGYFSSHVPAPHKDGEYLVIKLGTPYATVRSILKRIEQETGVTIRGFGDISAEEVSHQHRLTPKFAAMAKEREYDEPFYLDAPRHLIEQVLDRIEQAGLTWTPVGNHYSAAGNTDKGKALGILKELYRREYGDIETLGLGDSPNDFPLLSSVDLPMLVQQQEGKWADVDSGSIRRIDAVGPEGWSKAIFELFGD